MPGRTLRSDRTPAIADGIERRHLVKLGLEAHAVSALAAGAIFEVQNVAAERTIKEFHRHSLGLERETWTGDLGGKFGREWLANTE
jgi:hypothetical protein